MKKKYQDDVETFYMDENQKRLMAKLCAQPLISVAKEIRDEFVNDEKLLKLADFHLCNKIKAKLDSKDLSTVELLELFDLIPCVGGIHRYEVLSQLPVAAKKEPESELARLIQIAPEPCKKVLLSFQG